MLLLGSGYILSGARIAPAPGSGKAVGVTALTMTQAAEPLCTIIDDDVWIKERLVLGQIV